MKKSNAGKYSRLVLCIAVLIIIGTVGIAGTVAWNSHKVDQENILQSRNASVEIVETFPDTTVENGETRTKRVSFKNTGTASAFVRVAFTESWETADALLTGDTGVTKNWTAAFNTEWELKNDGWYYYKKVLPAGASTAEILSDITFPATVPTDAGYNLSFLAETVQVSDEDAVNTDATTKVFGRAAAVVNDTDRTVRNGMVASGNVSWS